MSESPEKLHQPCLVCGLESFLDLADLVAYTQVDLRRVKAEAKPGCKICKLLMEAVAWADQSEKLPPVANSLRKKQCLGSDLRMSTAPDKGSDWHEEEVFVQVWGSLDCIRFKKRTWTYMYEVFCTTEVEPFENFITRQLRVATSRPEDSVPLVTRWLDSCYESHPNCQGNLGLLPTRILDVGLHENDPIILRCNLKEASRYCALSHCWGSSKPFSTTMDTLKKRQKGILPDELPKTFQDVITFVRCLGIKYLWIDCLCIIQDDIHDWAKESSQMARVYGEAHLTIAAAQADDSSYGIFSNRLAPQGLPYYSHTTDEGQVSSIYVSRDCSQIHDNLLEDSIGIHSDTDEYPLMRRSWVFQERVLSKRIVYFTDHELLWECRSCTICECGRLDNEDESSRWNKLCKKHWWPESFSLDLWFSIIRNYSRLNITFYSDRLPAISGIAKHMQAIGAGEYVAGLWREHLLEQLSWTGIYDPQDLRPSWWNCPTWSWANFPAGQEIQFFRPYLREERSPDGPLFEARVLKVCCLPAGEDPTGQVLPSAFLTLEAASTEVTIDEFNMKNDYFTIQRNGDYLNFMPDFLSDFEETLSRENLTCVWISKPYFNPHLLLLRRSVGVGGLPATPGAFERVGITRLHWEWQAEIADSWFKNAKVKPITIV
ncbi:heterokaryon incompatibility protein-domain-containing protein [Halenospora varia]|nr:heterokaryon incompatibility protein-domain-containing protein [Halenospora varia]